MTTFPTGTITFLFTDIEGSTRLWERQPAAMEVAFRRHEAIMRQAITAHGGFAYKMIGDAFQAAFQTANDAVAASIAAQRALMAEPWGEVGALRVRMALHTGNVEERGDDYVGPALNRVARVMAAGHGGQILLTAATMELVRDALPPGVTPRDMGERRLKDLIRPERIFQLVAADLQADFAPLNTLDNRPNNLPVQATRFVGREREVEALRERLREPHVRLLTLVGPGGTGKTRLALQVAADFVDNVDDGVWFVDLGAISDPGLVGSRIAATLGVTETGSEPIADTLRAYLRRRQMLLVLDNFEQILDAAPLLADLISYAPEIKLLVTSREALNLYGEQEYPIPPLTLPEPGRLPPLEQLTQYEAVRLFIDRAQAVRPDFVVTNDNAPAIAEICVRLDGLPLAIELAAARTKLLPPDAILPRLDNRLKLLTGGPRNLPARQQTLRGAIDWSYSLLEPAEQRLFARLAVFAGGGATEAVAAVCDAGGELGIDAQDGLSSLLDKSLLRPQAEGEDEPRVVMLETIREFAAEQLEASGEGERLRRLHADYFLRLAEGAEAEVAGRHAERWLSRLEREHDNLRAALQWTLAGQEGERALRLGGSLWRFWEIRGYLSEGRQWLGRALALGDTGAREARAKALNGAGNLACDQGDLQAGRALLEEALAIRRELGDRASIAISLNNLGTVATDQADYAAARPFFEESLLLQRQLGNAWGAALALGGLGVTAIAAGDYAAAQPFLEESLQMRRELGDKRGMAFSLNDLGQVKVAQGDFEEGWALLEESLQIRRELDDRPGIAYSLNNLGEAAVARGDGAAAGPLFAESLQLQQELGDMAGIAYALEGLANVAGAEGDFERAVRLLAAVGALRGRIAVPAPPPAQAQAERILEAAEANMPPEEYTAAWQEGRVMTTDEAVSYGRAMT